VLLLITLIKLVPSQKLVFIFLIL